MAPLTKDDFIGTDDVKGARSQVLKLKGKQFSDIISEQKIVNPDGTDQTAELQWVDLVTAGGGMLGIGLLGYTYILEEAGIRFVGLGGTSAGAINTMLIAARRERPDVACSLDLVEILSKAPFASFLDGPEPPSNLAANKAADDFTMEAIKMYREKKGPSEAGSGLFSGLSNVVKGLLRHLPLIGVLANAMQSATGRFLKRNLPTLKSTWEHRGLHKGDEFEQWMKDSISPVETIATLLKKLEFKNEKLGNVEVKARKDAKGLEFENAKIPERSKLMVVASDITTQTRAIFPEQAPLYWKAEVNVHPARFARASMSIPYFFFPCEIPEGQVPNAGAENAQSHGWLSYNGTIPKKITFVDGGMLSNFPMELFHRREVVPLYPTFGVLLGNDPDQAQDTSNPAMILSAMFNSSRHILDRVYLEENRDKELCIGKICTKDFFWLDFNMPPETQVKLFAAGAKAAAKFLEEFNWATYKDFRTKEAKLKSQPEPKDSTGKTGENAIRAPEQ